MPLDPERLVAERDAAISERDAAIADHDSALAGVVTLEKQVETLTDGLAAALSRLSDIEARLKTNSGNSSKPPSSDTPGVKRRPPKSKGRKAGGQDGHAGKNFQSFVADAVTDTKPLVPAACGNCGTAFGADAAPKEAPTIFQTVGLPPIIPLVIEFQRHELCCPGCGGNTRAPLP